MPPLPESSREGPSDRALLAQKLAQTIAALEVSGQAPAQDASEPTATLRRELVRLELIATLIVHDMRMPLSAISDSAQLLLTEEGGKLYPEVAEMLKRIVAFTQEADALLLKAYEDYRSGKLQFKAGGQPKDQAP